MSEQQQRFEALVKEFGNGAHVTVPKEWMGQIAQVEFVGPYCPPLFSTVSEGAGVILDIDTNEDELACDSGLDDEITTVSGEVLEFNQKVRNDNSGMIAQVLIDANNRFYRIEIDRDAGADGWEDSQYTVERDISGDEIQETDKVISMEGGSMWKPVGAVESFGVKQKVK